MKITVETVQSGVVAWKGHGVASDRTELFVFESGPRLAAWVKRWAAAQATAGQPEDPDD